METDTHSSTQSDIHKSSSPDSERRTWRDSEFFRSLEAIRPYLSWAVMGIMAMVTLYLSFHDANAEQADAIKAIKDKQTQIQTQIDTKGTARDRQLESFKDEMVSKDLFNERSNNFQKELDEIKQSQKEILDRLPLRP